MKNFNFKLDYSEIDRIIEEENYDEVDGDQIDGGVLNQDDHKRRGEEVKAVSSRQSDIVEESHKP